MSTSIAIVLGWTKLIKLLRATAYLLLPVNNCLAKHCSSTMLGMIIMSVHSLGDVLYYDVFGKLSADN